MAHEFLRVGQAMPTVSLLKDSSCIRLGCFVAEYSMPASPAAYTQTNGPMYGHSVLTKAKRARHGAAQMSTSRQVALAAPTSSHHDCFSTYKDTASITMQG